MIRPTLVLGNNRDLCSPHDLRDNGVFYEFCVCDRASSDETLRRPNNRHIPRGTAEHVFLSNLLIILVIILSKEKKLLGKNEDGKTRRT